MRGGRPSAIDHGVFVRQRGTTGRGDVLVRRERGGCFATMGTMQMWARLGIVCGTRGTVGVEEDCLLFSLSENGEEAV